jgi:hypothetical protein
VLCLIKQKNVVDDAIFPPAPQKRPQMAADQTPPQPDTIGHQQQPKKQLFVRGDSGIGFITVGRLYSK